MTSYITAGPVNYGHPTFIERPEELLRVADLVQRGDGYPAVLGPPDIGKTTFLREVEAKKSKVWNIVSISCKASGSLDPVSVYKWIAEETNQQLKLGLPNDLMGIRTSTEFMTFLKTAGHLCHRTRLVFLIDRLEDLRSDTVLDVATALRAIFDERQRQVEYKKIVFIFAGREGLFDLCTENSPLKFDEQHRRFLKDFSVESTHRITDADGLGTYAEAIYSWVAGHPCLTQKFCHILQENPSLTVDQVADQLLRGGEFIYFKTQIAGISGETKNVMTQIVQGAKIDWDLGNPAVRRLAFLGVIKEDETRRCLIRNRLYEKILKDEIASKDGRRRQQEIFVDEKSGDVYVRGEKLNPPLTKDEYSFLAYLYKRCNEICSRDDIAIAVQGKEKGYETSNAAIDKLVERVRKRIERESTKPRYIETVHGRGYRLKGCR